MRHIHAKIFTFYSHFYFSVENPKDYDIIDMINCVAVIAANKSIIAD